MLRHLLSLPVFFAFLSAFLSLAGHADAARFEVRNIAVSIQAQDAVKARDMAISKAQRVAFAALVGKTENDLPLQITDTQIARLARGFSLQGERLAARSYAANFTIRFNPGPTASFIQASGLQLTNDAAMGQTISVNRVVTNAPPPVAAPSAGLTPDAASAPVTTEAKAETTAVVLPILDIGSRRVLWDEPDSWRDVWQRRDPSVPGLKLRVPLGDVEDVTDLPDASFLNAASGTANIPKMLQRYTASVLYVIVAKNQGAALDSAGGMALSLYRYDGQQLKLVARQLVRPRQGYLFDDAVPAAIQMMVTAEQGGTAAATTKPPVAETLEAVPEPAAASAVASSLVVTIPYQSLRQWIGIQKRLRMVPGVKSVVPLRVSPSSARVNITTTLSGNELNQNMGMQNFTLQQLANGEMALIDQ